MDQQEQRTSFIDSGLAFDVDLYNDWGHDLDSTRMLFLSEPLSVNSLTPSGALANFWIGKLQKPRESLLFNIKSSVNIDSIDIITKSNVVRDLMTYLSLREQLVETFKYFIGLHKSIPNSKASDVQASLDKFWKYYIILNQQCGEKIKRALERKEHESGHYVQLEEWQSIIFNQFFFSHPIGIVLSPEERLSLASEMKISPNRVADLFRLRTKRMQKFYETKQNRPRWVPKSITDEHLASLPRISKEYPSSPVVNK